MGCSGLDPALSGFGCSSVSAIGCIRRFEAAHCGRRSAAVVAVVRAVQDLVAFHGQDFAAVAVRGPSFVAAVND